MFKTIQQNEFVTLVLGVGVLLFVVVNRVHLRRLPSFRLIFCAFAAALGGWIASVAEGFVMPEALNVLEHFLGLLAAVLLAVWSWLVFVQGRAVRHDGDSRV